jgi:hypothetical protein
MEIKKIGRHLISFLKISLRELYLCGCISDGKSKSRISVLIDKKVLAFALAKSVHRMGRETIALLAFSAKKNAISDIRSVFFSLSLFLTLS